MSDIAAMKALGHRVYVFCINTHKHYIDTQNYGELPFWDGFRDYPLNTNSNIEGVVFSIFKQRPIQMARFWKRGIQQSIHHFIQSQGIDTLLCQGLAMTLYTKNISDKILLYRMHNLESQIWYDMTIFSSVLWKNIAYNMIGQAIERYEKNQLHNFRMVSLSRAESTAFKKITGLGASPISISLTHTPQSRYSVESEGLLFLGSLDWLPNREGLLWFLDTIYPLLENIPFTIAGKGNIAIPSSYPNIRILPNFPSTEDLFVSHRLLIVPLLSGAGIRIKIVEALQFGFPIISTFKGAEGIFDTSEVVELQDDPAHFASKIKELYYNPTALNAMSHRESSYYKAHFSIDMIHSQWNEILG